MSDTADAPIQKVVKDLGVTIHELLRYGLTGIVAIYVFAMTVSEEKARASLKADFEMFGTGGSALLTLAAGVIVYSLSRQTMIKSALFAVLFTTKSKRFWIMPFAIGLAIWHMSFSCVAGIFKLPRSPARWLGGPLCVLSLPFFWYGKAKTRHDVLMDADCSTESQDMEAAYFVIRHYQPDGTSATAGGGQSPKPLMDQDAKDQLYRQHSENHLIYAVALVILLAAVRMSHCQRFNESWYLLSAASTFWFVAFYSDLQLFRREGALLNLSKNDLRDALKSAGLQREAAHE